MCDCDELEFEDFEAMLRTLSVKSPAPAAQVQLQPPVLQISAPK